jgi:hypothetical protein
LSDDLWILTGDEDAVATSDQAAPGDLIVRRKPGTGTVEVGRLSEADAPRIEWFGDVDESLLPGTDELETAEDRPTPLQRFQGSTELKEAIDGVETAQRNRGG